MRDRLIVDPAHNEFGNLLAFPLWSHVSSTVNGGEIEALVADKEAGDLPIGVPRGPGLLNRPVKHLNPSAGAIGGHGPISISGVEEDFVAVLLENLVYPERTLVLIGVVLVYIIVAFLPGLHVIGDVQRSSNVLAVSIV